MDKRTKVKADVRITPTMQDSIKFLAGKHNSSYADMFRLLLVLGQISLKSMELSEIDIQDLLKQIKEEKENGNNHY